ncbi:hypothetical protein CEUSTIGMA_g9088.t1 [Chlamydomonas eustigma]|uniref:Uncharacterized protein n=1 Tax=Chlamydomonas eustigma TaxID=1157962 RepID=A0A250XFU4_9CHLO|nr:hypothetical protein CEUSTIGMA_g9088.t1 [Chlamydomonas eustigma]|eukprot:GAX81660.1 hypothetical protein CEUSTIGMA_g9088.t1 [Chlamydomonas eustigma]
MQRILLSKNVYACTQSPQYSCKRCKQRFRAIDNGSKSCRFHPELFSGGEVAKAIGFVRMSTDPKDQLKAVKGKTGLMRFWDCCGEEEETSPGCQLAYHLTYDEELNEVQGWH